MIDSKPISSFDNVVNHFTSLPGIGKKTAQRLVLKLLNRSNEDIENFGASISNLCRDIKYCKTCFNITESNLCYICLDTSRDKSIICVVEHILDVNSIEKANAFNGVYHVLGGLISPMEGIAPSDIKVTNLLERVKNNSISEIIFALSTTMEGDATNFYMYKHLADTKVKLTTIAKGVGIGSEIEYTDEITLNKSIQNRLPFDQFIG